MIRVELIKSRFCNARDAERGACLEVEDAPTGSVEFAAIKIATGNEYMGQSTVICLEHAAFLYTALDGIITDQLNAKERKKE